MRWRYRARCAAPCWWRTASGFGESGRFVNQQWLWFNAATMASAIVGGQLVQWLSPASALHTAAAIVAMAPVRVLLGTLFLIPEERTRIDAPALRSTHSPASVAALQKARAVDRRPVSVSLLFQSRLRHAALLHDDRQPSISPRLYRHPGIDHVGRLDGRRVALSSAVRQHLVQAPAQSEHCARNRSRPPRTCCCSTRPRLRS